ncbi:hypothetical protein PoB_003367100 [Plakobranchus ocellatus]|uniref:DUF1566 domain-containing protein n=1 Tax=Plakobranchus ocellatus TaxID=259542 RepID=A0AAV4A7G8_9GAST|nr:hypothetical protein PoB_003367100 [Plakobranchus ocellatus]
MKNQPMPGPANIRRPHLTPVYDGDLHILVPESRLLQHLRSALAWINASPGRSTSESSAWARVLEDDVFYSNNELGLYSYGILPAAQANAWLGFRPQSDQLSYLWSKELDVSFYTILWSTVNCRQENFSNSNGAITVWSIRSD